MRLLNFVVPTVICLALVGGLTSAVGQDRLPPYVRSNAYVAGQVLGCAIRIDRYLQQTLDRAANAGRTLSATELNVVAGLDLAALKSDAQQALVAQSEGNYPAEEIELAILEIADAEYDGSIMGAPGYSEAWLQAMGCAALFRQFELYDRYQ